MMLIRLSSIDIAGDFTGCRTTQKAFIVAAVQDSPVFLDLKASVNKAGDLIAKASIDPTKLGVHYFTATPPDMDRANLWRLC